MHQPMTLETLNILTAIHFISMAGLAVYGAHRVWLLACWQRHRKRKSQDMAPPAMARIPRVTVQVPLYNEPMVAARIIDAVAALAWPRNLLDIQILDDSTDTTREIVQTRVRHWASRGIPITCVTRQNRAGYKAGALKNGMDLCRGEFIAIFDADFVPEPDFLERTLPWFHHPCTGMVQARWTFLNEGYSWLTRLQALLLAPHFSIEHEIRSTRGLFFNFNGTAGVWRKQAIETSGGWQDDTVTEDLDLSYRAQLAGWKFIYLDAVTVPSELPITLSDFRSQQERWSKGSIQTARKILPRLLSAPIPVRIKIEGIAHLLANLCWVSGFLITMTLYPVLVFRMGIGLYQVVWIDLPLFLMSTGAVLSYYLLHGVRAQQGERFPAALCLLPAISIGLAPCFALSVVRGIFQKGGVFKRTPKSGLTDRRPSKYPKKRYQAPILGTLLFNMPLLAYSFAPLIFTWHQGTWAALPLLSLFPMGFLLVVGMDLHGLIQSQRQR